MANKNMQETTFWQFIQVHKIVIPIIQRDYAQGRIGKEKLREKFLKDLKSALDNNEKLKLDFVYGSEEFANWNPLDGQQRLTTLWLLHWYIAYKAGKLTEHQVTFNSFSYETRTSSREFCNKLSEFNLQPENTETRNENGIETKREIVELIQNQTWFYSAWKQDPTIQAMLHMLGGTTIKDKKGSEIVDGIEEVFNGCKAEKYSEYWSKLTGDNCPIIFYALDLHGLKLTDDLYIKMNARGKALTSFENFKADLVGYLNEKGFDKETEPQNTFAHKLDTSWTDIFWKYKSPEHKIDEIYFAFMNRYFLNTQITTKKSNKKNETDFMFSAEKLEKDNKAFKYLYGDRSNDTKLTYNSFEDYKPIFEKENSNTDYKEQVFTKLSKTLDSLYEAYEREEIEDINKLFHPVWDENSKFRFIPEYEKGENSNHYYPTNLTQQQRVVFHAVCRYFETGSYEEKSLKQWMRVVWNIVENANINSVQAMIGAMRLIDELGEHSHKINEFLANPAPIIKSDTAKEQVEEEILKAKLIQSEEKEWKELILEAEKRPLFSGQIAFLLKKFNNKSKEIIDVSVEDIEHYKENLDVAFELWDAEGAKFLNQLVFRALLAMKFPVTKETGLHNNKESWKKVFRNDDFRKSILELFSKIKGKNVKEALKKEIVQYPEYCDMHEDCRSFLIKDDNLIDKMPYIWRWNKDSAELRHFRTARADSKRYFIYPKRDNVFESIEEILNTEIQKYKERLFIEMENGICIEQYFSWDFVRYGFRTEIKNPLDNKSEYWKGGYKNIKISTKEVVSFCKMINMMLEDREFTNFS